MGYTHYWKVTKPLTPEKYEEFTTDVKAILTKQSDHLAGAYGTGTPEITEHGFSFNGIGDEGHETFSWSNKSTSFDFCKTARKPYDAVVCAVLILVKKYYGVGVEISSDGTWPEWWEGRVLFTTTFGEAYGENLYEEVLRDDYISV